MAGDQEKEGDVMLVVTVMLPLFCPQVVVVGVAVAVLGITVTTIGTRVLIHPATAHST